jgi:hypothetical protein
MDDLFEIGKEVSKKKWLKASGRLLGVISELEKELVRMKKNNVSNDLILAKNQMIDDLVDFYNSTEKVINLYENEITIQRLNTKLNEQIFKGTIYGTGKKTD